MSITSSWFASTTLTILRSIAPRPPSLDVFQQGQLSTWPSNGTAYFFITPRLSNGCARESIRLALRLINHPRTVAVSAQLPSKNQFSISDDELESRGFSLHRSTDNLNITHLNSVFAAVGFPRRDPDKIRVALENTDLLLWVEYKKTQRPVAFARATGDEVFNAIIWDVVVDPSFQGMGLGKAVMERLVTMLLRKGITNIALFSEPRVLGFYRPLGFVADPDGIRGMVYARKQKKKK